MEDGIDTENTLRYLRNIRMNNDISYGFRAMLETIMAGAMWPATRINSINSNFDALCPRCGTEPET